MRASHFLQLAIFAIVTALVLVRWPRRSASSIEMDMPASATNPSRVTELTYAVWGMPWEDLLFERHYARNFERHMRARGKNIRIRYLRYGSTELINKYNAWHLRGTGADVMRQHFSMYDNLVMKGVNAPLDEFIHHPENGIARDIPDFIPEVWERCRIGGKFYAVPEDQNQQGLFYSKEIFDRYNAAHPDDRVPYPDGTWTWNDLRKYADKLTVREGKRVEVYGFDMLASAGPFFLFFYQAGGKVWNEDGTRTLINSAEGIEVLNFWRKLVRNLNIARPSEMRDSAVGPDKLFEFGKTAMFIDGTWRIPDVKKQAPKLRFGVAQVPMHPRRRAPTTIGGCCLWAISSHSRKKELAWEFIKYLVSKESNDAYWDILWVAPPARLSSVFSDEFKDTRGITIRGSALIPGLRREEFEEKVRWMVDYLRRDPKTGKTSVRMDHYSLYHDDLVRHLNIAIQKFMLPGSTLTAREVLDECAAQVSQVIQRDRKLRGQAT